MNLENISVFITGGASGLGAATAELMVSRGAFVTIFDRNAELAKSVSEKLGASASWASGDVTSESDVMAGLESACSKGALRLAVSCAGVGLAERIVKRDGSPHSLSSFERVINTNLIGTFNVLRLSSALMTKFEALEGGERGVIINTASIAAYDGQIGQVAYSASKGGIVGLTLPAARDLASVGIRVMAIAPGIVDTPLLGQLPNEVRTNLASSVPFPKRLGLPSDYANLVEAIVLNEYLNGEVIRIDGALRMGPK